MAKKIELSCKALGAGMFMGTVCAYLAIGAVLTFISSGGFYYHVTFPLLIQGIVVSMAASALWVLCFTHAKGWGFATRYMVAFVPLAVLFVISVFLPVINGAEGHILWVASGVFSTLAFGTTVAVASNKHYKNTGSRSALLWEIS